jgi:hypothetical protein
LQRQRSRLRCRSPQHLIDRLLSELQALTNRSRRRSRTHRCVRLCGQPPVGIEARPAGDRPHRRQVCRQLRLAACQPVDGITEYVDGVRRPIREQQSVRKHERNGRPTRRVRRLGERT